MELVLFVNTSGIAENILNRSRRRLQTYGVQLAFRGQQLFELLLQFRVTDQGIIDFLRLLLRSLVV